LTDVLESTFKELRRCLGHEDRLAPTHTDPFFTFVHDPAETLELHRQLPRFRAILERDGFQVKIQSLSELAWDIVEASERWEEWLDAEEPGAYEDANGSMKDVLSGGEDAASAGRPGLISALSRLVQDETPGRLLLLTDAALLHPWVRIDKLSGAVHDKIRCPTVLFYPGSRRGPFGIRFLGFYPEDPSAYRTAILGGQ
jgi:hypothetical protein